MDLSVGFMEQWDQLKPQKILQQNCKWQEKVCNNSAQDIPSETNV